MNIETLNKANELNKFIKECDQALNCLDIRDYKGDGVMFHRTPRLVLDVDNLEGSRQLIKLPIISDEIFHFLKAQIIKDREKANTIFHSL